MVPITCTHNAVIRCYICEFYSVRCFLSAKYFNEKLSLAAADTPHLLGYKPSGPPVPGPTPTILKMAKFSQNFISPGARRDKGVTFSHCVVERG